MLSVRLDEATEVRLQATCRRLGLTRSEAVKRSLEQWMDGIEPARDAFDLADATLVWLAQVEGSRRLLTVDRRDFDMLRTLDGQPFERLWVQP